MSTWGLKHEIARLESELSVLKRDKALLLDAIAHCGRHNKKLIRDRLREKKAPQDIETELWGNQDNATREAHPTPSSKKGYKAP